MLKLGFPTRPDSATFWDEETEDPLGQQDKLKILPQAGTGQDSQSKSRPGCGTGQVLIFCHGMGWDGILTACPVPSQNMPGQPGDRREKRVKNYNF